MKAQYGGIKKGWEILVILCVLYSCPSYCQSKKVNLLHNDSIALASPRLQVDSLLFKEHATITLALGLEGSEIRYTLDKSSVTTNSSLYDSPLRIQKTTQLKAKAFHPLFRASGTEKITLRKIQQDIIGSKITLQPGPHEKYMGEGPNTLINGRKGGMNFRDGAFWLGFQSPEIFVHLTFNEPKTFKKVVLSLLKDQSSWIFLPRTVTIHSEGKKIGSILLGDSSEKGIKRMDFVEIAVPKASYRQMEIRIETLEEIPSWHPGKGTLPWTFIDEILIE